MVEVLFFCPPVLPVLLPARSRNGQPVLGTGARTGMVLAPFPRGGRATERAERVGKNSIFSILLFVSHRSVAGLDDVAPNAMAGAIETESGSSQFRFWSTCDPDA